MIIIIVVVVVVVIIIITTLVNIIILECKPIPTGGWCRFCLHTQAHERCWQMSDIHYVWATVCWILHRHWSYFIEHCGNPDQALQANDWVMQNWLYSPLHVPSTLTNTCGLMLRNVTQLGEVQHQINCLGQTDSVYCRTHSQQVFQMTYPRSGQCWAL